MFGLEFNYILKIEIRYGTDKINKSSDVFIPIGQDLLSMSTVGVIVNDRNFIKLN